MIKFAIMVMVAIMFIDQYREFLGDRFWYIIAWLGVAVFIDFLVFKADHD